MARRTVDLQIIDEGRDKGKMYLITEMSAYDTEKWANKVASAIVRNATKEELELIFPLFYSYLRNVNKKPQVDAEAIQILKQDAGADKINIENATQALAINFSLMYKRLPNEETDLIEEELLKCCKHYTSYEAKMTDDVLNNHFLYCEEPDTIFALKQAAFALHTDFFLKAVTQNLSSLAAQIEKKSDK